MLSANWKDLFLAVYGEMADFDSLTQKIAIENAVLRLPPDQQNVLSWHFNQRKSIKEISCLLNCSLTTTYNKLNRGLFTLRNIVNPSSYRKMYEILYPETGKPGNGK